VNGGRDERRESGCALSEMRRIQRRKRAQGETVRFCKDGTRWYSQGVGEIELLGGTVLQACLRRKDEKPEIKEGS